jgi:phage terminase small subunit
MPEKKPRRLTPRQQRFIAAYTDPDAPTFGNATQSYLHSHPTPITTSTASSEGHRTLKTPLVRETIDQILERNNASYQVRIEHLLSIALGQQTVKTRTEQRGADGNLISEAITERDISPADRTRALKMLHDLTGESDLARARGQVMSQDLRRKANEMLQRHEKAVERAGSPREYTSTDSTAEAHHANPHAAESNLHDIVDVDSEPVDTEHAESSDSGENGEEHGHRVRGEAGGGGYIIHGPSPIRGTVLADPHTGKLTAEGVF